MNLYQQVYILRIESVLLNSKQTKKNIQQRNGKKTWTLNNTIFCVAGLIILPIASFATFRFLSSSSTYSSVSSLFTSQNTSAHETSIPWIDNPSECQYTDRSWHDNKCWDEQHSPTF
ncbi:hypothetical protein NIES3275_45490 [Microchaete diplosiphon NIES-3275]|nr:hypothetical protein NIES3275_45490 [Microchaete diplosiphon NIES-3275]